MNIINNAYSNSNRLDKEKSPTFSSKTESIYKKTEKNIEIHHISAKLNQKNMEYRQKSENLFKIPKNIDTTAESLDKSGHLKSPLKIENEKKVNIINSTRCIIKYLIV